MRRHGKPIVSRRDKRPAIIKGDIARIPLGLDAKDGYANVDREYAYLADDNWRLSHYGYAIRSKDKQLLHRIIMQPPQNYVVDHISGDKLDNTKGNLRNCRQSDNSRNQGIHKNNKSGYKGVSFNSRRNMWFASVSKDYQKIHLGQFATALEAAVAYNKKAVELFGDFARLNNV